MNHAITILEIALETLRNNEPIHRAEGNVEQADSELRGIEEITTALRRLRISEIGPNIDPESVVGQHVEPYLNDCWNDRDSLRRFLICWASDAAFFCRSMEYYRDLVIRCGEALGPEAKTCDDGTVLPDVLLCEKVPELVERLAARTTKGVGQTVTRETLEAQLERIEQSMAAIPGEPCGGTIMHCTNPRHSEYHGLLVEREKVREALGRLNHSHKAGGVGQAVMEEIIKQPMFTMECPDSPQSGCLAVWNGNAAEQIEAIIFNYKAD